MHLPVISSDVLFPKNRADAAGIQTVLPPKVITQDQYEKIETIASFGVSNNLYDPEQMVYAGIINLHYQALKPIETAEAASKQALAYIAVLL